MDMEKIRWIEKNLSGSNVKETKITIYKNSETVWVVKVIRREFEYGAVFMFKSRDDLIECAKIYRYADRSKSIMQHLYDVLNDTTEILMTY